MNKWKRFYFESNQFFDYIENLDDWQRLKSAYPRLSDDELLDAKQATYNGSLSQKVMDAHNNYGFRLEHDGDKTLRDFFKESGMEL